MKFDFKSNFDEKKILTPAEKAERKILMGFGGYVRSVARRSIKKGGPFDKSYDGQSPVGHANELYRNFIAFGYDEKRHEVSIGSALLTGTRGDIAPEKIEYGGTEVFSRETLLNPQIPIPPQLTELHGISDEKVADASVLADVVDEWTGLLSNREFAVTYNGRRFDDGFIAHEWQRVGKTYSPVPMIDVCDYLMYCARKNADGKGNKLGDWCERAGIELVNAHSAVADCRATGRLFLWGMGMGIIPRTVEWALKIAAKIAEFHDLERELYDRVLYVDRRPDVDPIVRITFGKHAGQSINAAPKSYLQWCLLNTDFPESVKLLFRQRIGGIEVQADGRLVAMREEITAMYAEASAAEKSSKARVICPTCLAAYEVLSDTAEPRNRMCPACTTRLKSDGNLCNLCMNRVDYRRDSFIGTPPEVLRNKLPVLHCSAEELADVKECQHFRPVTPQEIANTAKAIGCVVLAMRSQRPLTFTWGHTRFSA
jgi:DNA polymerase-3 subunit epsilon